MLFAKIQYLREKMDPKTSIGVNDVGVHSSDDESELLYSQFLFYLTKLSKPLIVLLSAKALHILRLPIALSHS